MSKTFVTSDLHFGHNQPFLYGFRGFKNIYEHDEAIIKNWNSVVQPEDDVYILGDIMLNNNDAGIMNLKSLKGKIHIVRGNHDTPNRMELYQYCYNVVEITEGQFLKYKQHHFYLTHYPCIASNFDYDKPLKARTISLCGHSHTKNPFLDWNYGVIYHCELDAHNMFPVELDQIIIDLDNKLKR